MKKSVACLFLQIINKKASPRGCRAAFYYHLIQTKTPIGKEGTTFLHGTVNAL